MAIPRYGDNTQTLKPLTGERLQAADFGSGGEAIGRAVQGFGQQLGQAAEVVDKVAEKYDEAAVRKADAEDAMKLLEIKQRALSAKGIDAQSAIEAANKEIEQVGKERQASFSSSRQRAMYADVFGRRKLSVTETLGDHAIKQTEVAYQAGLDASIDSGTSLAVDSHDDPEEFQRNLVAVEHAVEEKFKGMPAGVVARAKSIARSNIHGKVVETMLNNPDNVADAAMYLRDNAADIDPEAETKLWKMVNPFLDEERTAGDASWAMSGAPAPNGSDHVDDEDYYAPDPLAPTDAPEAKLTTRDAKPVATTPPAKFVSPLRGVGRVSNTAAQHKARGSDNAIDYAAPAGTPIYPPMSGKVKFSGWTEKGGWTVLVEHPNGYVTGYAHLRAKSALEPGEEVDRSSVLGGVGNTGSASHGNHVHFTVRKSGSGPKVDPASVAWDDTGTVDPKGVKWQEDKLASYAAEDTDASSALARLHQRATAEGWSSRRYEKAATEVRQRASVNQTLYSQANRRLEDGIWGKFAEAEQAGSPITSIAQLGPNFASLDGSAKARVINMIQANKKALTSEDGDAVKANGDTFLDLLEGSATDPKAFANIDLRSIPDITRGERARLIGVQSKLLGKDGEPSNFAVSHARVLTSINRFAGLGNDVGFTPGAKTEDHKRRAAVLFNAVTKRADERQQELKRPLTDDEMQAIVRSQTVTMVRSGKELPRYIAERTPKKEGEVDQINVPADKRQQIIRVYQRTHGGAMPSNRDVVARYLQWLSNNGG